MSFLLEGDTIVDVMEGYPRITEEDIKTCKEFTMMLFDKPALLKNIKEIA